MGQPLFETKQEKSRPAYRLYLLSMIAGIFLVFVYRASHVPGEGEDGRWAWIGLFGAELWFSVYWVFTQSRRWNRVYRQTFKDRLSQRYENELPSIDVFVCTADPTIEPPTMVINTVLSVMAYDYPPEKLNVYLSDDGGSDLTFYALLEASHFSKYWLPFCKKFKVEPRSPAAYFSATPEPLVHASQAKEFLSIKKLYKEMVDRIETTSVLGKVSEEIIKEHQGFLEWGSGSNPRNHPTILQILIDGRDPNVVDMEGQRLPTLVYLAREKRPHHHHNFKAGAMNALIRVSSGLSNGQVIMNVDCDMFSNNSSSVRDALCFLMDEENGHQISFVQFPQAFNNITKNDIYCNYPRVISQIEFPGLDGEGGPMYIGSGCFHRRDTLCGRKYSKEHIIEWKIQDNRKVDESIDELKERLKGFASCTYEENTEWGKEMGLKYGCPVEDVITGLSIQCRGWKSVFFSPERKAFIGVAPTTLDQVLVQHKRWSEGDFQIFLSKYNPLLVGHGKIKVGLQMGYCSYCLWAPNCLATLYYVVIPSLCFLKGTALFPKISSPWLIPFAYVAISKYTYSLLEFLWCGGTVQGWWNNQRMWMFKRTTSYLFAFIDNLLKVFGFSKSTFVITTKVADQDVSQRYEQEMMEFGTSSPLFLILATIAMLNLFSLVGGVWVVIMSLQTTVMAPLSLQFVLCGIVVAINLPVYQGLFFRMDKGRMPSSIMFKAVFFALFACIVSLL
ncbi:PREDICTED: cellulose synthase-like protein E6 [Nelumbo nucifera]|uniref:Cellulose synthase-like protein E6 n=1 Tax=Nelumbo nucifera TaxID=4432 RepID=A0A1U7ZIB2_NELNU|nr:PREDICTED: cellulose synthase-like protein E6 [Nelumbo nucifera]